VNQTAATDSDQTPTGSPAWSRRLRFELIFNGILLLAGLLLLPAAIFYTGQQLLGEYASDGRGLLDLYASVLKDMGRGHLAAWVLCLSPLWGITLLRLLWLPLRRKPRAEPPADEM
jgi:hypothetical protein